MKKMNLDKSIICPDAVEHFHQPINGYRFSQDSIALSDFVQAREAHVLVDLGAGCGVVGLSALEKKKAPEAREFFFVEREELFFPHLQKNLDLYQRRTDCRLYLIQSDWNDLSNAQLYGRVDYIMTNPPFFPSGASRPSKNPSIDRARREEEGALALLAACLEKLLRPGGKAAIVFPLSREKELLDAIGKRSLKPLRICRANKVFFMEFVKFKEK